MSSTIAIPAALLAALIGMAKSHVEDIETGLEDGTYEADDNLTFPDQQKALAEAEALLASDAKGESSVQVRYWDCYGDLSCVHTHQMDIVDQRQTNGQLYVDLGALEGNPDDLLSVTLEVNTNPLNGIDHVPCAHVHFDGDSVAMSLFKIGDRILARPETQVTIEPFQQTVNGVLETLYWIE